jgi:preprotein translocase subunit SecF
MPLLKKTPKFDFMGRRRLALAFSATLIALSLASLVFRGLNFGLDFTGGVLLEVDYGRPAVLEDVRSALTEAGYTDALVQNFGTASDVLIRLPPVDGGATLDGAGAAPAGGDGSAAEEPGADVGQAVLSALRTRNPDVNLLRTEFVGPQVGADLREQGSLAMLFTLIMIFGYVMLRFRWKFAAGAIAALVHDVMITVGFFSIFQLNVDLSVLAAVLAVIGYSLNDTIVVYDRIRENFRAIRRGGAVEIVNTSINQTLSRTIITALTTLFVLFALLVLGGEAIAGFSIALIVGIVIGTYSSVYIASALALVLEVTPADLMPTKREEVDEMP